MLRSLESTTAGNFSWASVIAQQRFDTTVNNENVAFLKHRGVERFMTNGAQIIISNSWNYSPAQQAVHHAVCEFSWFLGALATLLVI